MISNMVDPPQGDDYLPMTGSLFPKHYPIGKNDKDFEGGYYFKKYFMTQR